MSYLGPVRLHFAGQFQANVSTVNNDPTHFDNGAFLSTYQDMQTATAPNGWFNPQGDAAFRLKGCTVTSAWTADGEAAATDPIRSCLVADSDRAVPAKLVDLDPEQQLVSTIWGLEVRITDAQGHNLLSATFEPAAFMDIWDRALGGGGDIGACAAYQSVLTGLEWGDVTGSPFLAELQSASAASGTLSIKFMTDSLNANFTSPDFMCGRIVGTIGPAAVGEPEHLVTGRHFMASAGPGGNFFNPAGHINFCAGVVDDATSTIYLDLGNALHTRGTTGVIINVGDLTLGTYDPLTSPASPAGSLTPIGVLPSQGPNGYASDPGWYARTAGIVAIPLTPPQRLLAAESPLAITGPANAATAVFIAERPAGTFVRADGFVVRMSPDDTQVIAVHASQWGRPLVGAEIAFELDSGQLQAWPGIPVATPDVLTFGDRATTDQAGVAHLEVSSADPGTPRWFEGGAGYGIDGQVYGIRPEFADPELAAGPVNQWDFISLLVWSKFEAPDPVTWPDVQPIFEQYANLYPVMLRFLNLADHQQVVDNASLLQLAFSLPMSDPNTMPVTRDLSPAKRAAILAWLADPLPGDQPATDGSRSVAASEVADAAPERATIAAATAAQGGKAAAAGRRLILTHTTEGATS